ncbi:lipid II:glycine glycyltransferase FemX [Alkalispirochaeta alkalica]|uniref:lipid II:glycine glycyltransferase FemX n=1 Tax=Alkalispirochaeta alkalica TaxID=46356 RepID=UPI000381FDF9|nr:peptidoglycan bridge formation glycyltransferase FemA/FemB family protein [Alkalispirochaeta alkalica]
MTGSLLQTAWWGELKEEFGWSVTAVSGGERVFCRSLGPFRLGYIPFGFSRPGGDLPGPEATDGVVRSMRAAARELPGRLDLLRWDVPWGVDHFDREAALAAGLRPAPVRVQPPDTVVVSLDGDEETLLSRMKSKTRYNIRLARRRGVTIEAFPADDPRADRELALWYRLYQDTARRDRITIHPLRYYQRVLELSRREDAPLLTLYQARHEGDLLGGIVVVSWEGTSTYLYGAGADIKRNLMASYLLQWEALRGARARGDGAYDLFGIPPSDDPAHPMHGLYRFKTGFGGEILHRPGCWDLPLRRGRAWCYRGAEGVRGWYYQSLRKSLAGSLGRIGTALGRGSA